MPSFATIIATFTAVSAVSASPIMVRDTCGSAPSGSGSQTPLSQPTGIQTAQACQDACDANGSCQSFVFGMVDNTIKCMLFAVPAAQVPQQDTNLVVFDKACTSVPAVTPTTSNPTGAATSGSGSDSTQNGQQSTNNQNGQQSQQSGNSQQQGGQKLAVRDTCGATPAGSNANQQPLSQPTGVNSAADCLAKCKADSSCQSFEFGAENGANVCRLFSVAAAEVPPPADGQSFQVFDVGCSI